MPYEPTGGKQPPGERSDELLAMVAHELRRPLTALLGALGTLQQRGQALSIPQQDELVGMARRQGEQLRRLLDQVLVAAGLDRGDAGPAGRSLVDVVALAREAGLAARLAHPDRPISIDLAGPLLVRADPLAVSRVLGNLLDNAAAHSHPECRCGCRPAAMACTRCWPSRTPGPASHPLGASASSSGTRDSISSPVGRGSAWGWGCTSPGGLPAPTAASSASPTRPRGWGSPGAAPAACSVTEIEQSQTHIAAG